MIIQCENCQTKFNIPDGSIGKDGRFVRCSQCEYEWLQKPEDENIRNIELNNSNSTNPNLSIAEDLGISHPVKSDIKHKPELPSSFITSRWLLYISLAFFALSLLFALAVVSIRFHMEIEKALPISREMFKLLGLHNTQGLELADMAIKLRENTSAKDAGKYKNMTIIVGINNATKATKELDTIRFSVFDKNWGRLKELTVPLRKSINPESFESITSHLNEIPIEAVFLAVEIGNGIEIKIQDISNVVKKDHS
jgi:predicted Zn finger-like uncharacterized protein